MKMKKSLSIIGGMILVAVTSLTSCQQADVAGAATLKWSEKEQSLTFRQVRAARGYNDTKSDGRTLILPVQFTDFPYTNLYGEKRETDGARKDIYTVNFGESKDTQWESLRSFYTKSSYGKANLTGGVAPWFNPYEDNALSDNYGQKYDVKEFAANHSGYNGAEFVLEQFMTYIQRKGWKETFLVTGENGQMVEKTYTSKEECLQDFDADHDGFIDNLQMVYTCPPHVEIDGKAVDNELFWAFRSITQYPAKVTLPNPYNYLWLSYETFFENGVYVNNKYREYTDEEKIAGVGPNGEKVLDAHTLIHETGHALGAEDYYTNTKSDEAAAAQFIMMAHNVGDHDCWTKLLYGWTDPTVVYKPTTITINKFQQDGSSILIPARRSWSEAGEKHTVADEYIMLEYFTLDGLYEHDIKTPYIGSQSFYGTTVSKTGLRIWHIDARLASFSYDSNAGAYLFRNYTDKLIKMDNGYTYFGAFNDKEDAVTAKVPNRMAKLIACVNVKTSNAGGKFTNNKAGNSLSNDNILSDVGQVLKSGSWKFNSGKSFGYNIKVVAKTDSTITVELY